MESALKKNPLYRNFIFIVQEFSMDLCCKQKS